MVGTSMPCTETIDGWIPGIDAQPRTPKEEIRVGGVDYAERRVAHKFAQLNRDLKRIVFMSLLCSVFSHSSLSTFTFLDTTSIT